MKSKLFIVALIGLCLSFSRANPQTVASSSKVDNVPSDNFGVTCLDTYLTFCNSLWNIMSMGIQTCGVNYPNDPDGQITCNSYYTDMYLNMHGVADAMYDRCKANEAQQ